MYSVDKETHRGVEKTHVVREVGAQPWAQNQETVEPGAARQGYKMQVSKDPIECGIEWEATVSRWLKAQGCGQGTEVPHR
jgi:hypothetical protein